MSGDVFFVVKLVNNRVPASHGNLKLMANAFHLKLMANAFPPILMYIWFAIYALALSTMSKCCASTTRGSIPFSRETSLVPW